MFKLSELYIKSLLARIYKGEVTSLHLPQNFYLEIANYLKQGAYKGYGINFKSLAKKVREGSKQFDMSDYELLSELRNNVYMFSAAKTYQQVREISGLIVDNKGVLRPFNEFQKDANKVFDLYNKTWLKTEYETAIGQAQNAVKWQQIEKQANVLPMLMYDAVLDKNTSDICRPLDGLVAPVNDPVWKKIMPLNHFNCRCMVKQLSKEEGRLTTTAKKEKAFNEAMGAMDDVFKMNPGKDGYIFKPDHPYFSVPKGDKDFAKKNFGLPIPKND